MRTGIFLGDLLRVRSWKVLGNLKKKGKVNARKLLDCALTFTVGLFVQKKKNRKFAGSKGLRCDESARLLPTWAGFEAIFGLRFLIFYSKMFVFLVLRFSLLTDN